MKASLWGVLANFEPIENRKPEFSIISRKTLSWTSNIINKYKEW
ncbi:hypothetical protein [Clostridium amylolyticum]|nr:hypothetical protein [Clostridium amylolyticum]